MNTPSKSVENTEKRIYTAPKLVSYGALNSLTQGGIGSVTEAQAGNKDVKKRV